MGLKRFGEEGGTFRLAQVPVVHENPVRFASLSVVSRRSSHLSSVFPWPVTNRSSLFPADGESATHELGLLRPRRLPVASGRRIAPVTNRINDPPSPFPKTKNSWVLH